MKRQTKLKENAKAIACTLALLAVSVTAIYKLPDEVSKMINKGTSLQQVCDSKVNIDNKTNNIVNHILTFPEEFKQKIFFEEQTKFIISCIILSH